MGTQFEDMGRVQSRSRNAGYHRFFIASLEHGPVDWRKRHGVAENNKRALVHHLGELMHQSPEI